MLFHALLEKSLNRVSSANPYAAKSLKRLANKTIVFRLKQPTLIFSLNFSENGISVQSSEPNECDLILSGTIFNFLRLQLNPDKSAIDTLDASGDFTLLQDLNPLLSPSHIDWAELLSDCIGDVPAHHLCQFLFARKQHAAYLAHTWQHNIKEYLEEELNVAPPAALVTQFYRDIDTLRDDVARLEARLALRIPEQEEDLP